MKKSRIIALVGLVMLSCNFLVGGSLAASAVSINDQVIKESNSNARFNKIDSITIGSGIKPVFPQSDGKPEFVRIHVTTAGFPPVLRWYSNGKKSGYLTKESHSSQAPGIIWFVTYSGYIK
ncbi:hypothetical protein [Enterococcus wangshanyuanii]|uniref:Ig-like domain-containing protein n=1 Tax=Enterococcus wangshanyuanii TaxID=2005703 RepID=A0ABQ1NFX8_9ENTE|nr:hypothetical protein [Enterococcus wangshanyuanii]GGC75969.1 hypothetical protein GCM10011573_01930 [Enterococcus wangshanyuanii]